MFLRRFNSQYIQLFGLVLFAASLAGCSGGGPGQAKVSGMVTLNGETVPSGAVMLISEEGLVATSEIQSNGAYSVSCVPATYRVAVSNPAAIDPIGAPPTSPTAPAAKSTPIPAKYHDVGSSGIIVEVKPGANSIDLALLTKTAK